MKTMALPRSGCLATSRVGTPAIRQAGTRSRSVAGASRPSASPRAHIQLTASLASPAGRPTPPPPPPNQDPPPPPAPPPPPPPRGHHHTTNATPQSIPL